MKTKSFIILMLALALPAGILHAQEQNGNNPPPPSENDGPPGGGPGGPGGRHHRPPPMPLIQALDTNHDGVLSADEIANAPANLLKLDKNGDGQLTKDEYLPPRPPRRGGGTNAPDGPPPPDGQNDSGQAPHHRPIPPIVAALDTNGDGIISADEIANASASLMKLDKNGDGQLTMDELMGPRPHRDEAGPGPDGPQNGQRPPPPDQNQ